MNIPDDILHLILVERSSLMITDVNKNKYNKCINELKQYMVEVVEHIDDDTPDDVYNFSTHHFWLYNEFRNGAYEQSSSSPWIWAVDEWD